MLCHDEAVLDAGSADYLYLAAVRFIRQVTPAPLLEQRDASASAEAALPLVCALSLVCALPLVCALSLVCPSFLFRPLSCFAR